jgi:hypothetical protein
VGSGPIRLPTMSNPEFDSTSDKDEWDERGELAWNEFDWEYYLRAQDDTIVRYLDHYLKLSAEPDRIDRVAKLMGWEEEDWSSEAPGADDGTDEGDDPYTLHKNPIFIATRAIHLRIERGWELIAGDPREVPQALAVAFQAALHREEHQAMLAVQALDFGDYAMSISLFKRALRDLNGSLALLGEAATPSAGLSRFREAAVPCLFDLREIWLRVMAECREELEQPPDEDDD